MPWVVAGAAVAGGASIFAGSETAGAAKSAAGQQAAAIQSGLDYQRGIYNTAQGNLNPYISTGQSALYSLASLYGLPGGSGGGAQQAFTNFTQTPAYQFPFQQGQLASTRAVNALGGAGMGKALTQYGQGYASQGFNSYLTQLAGLAGLGQSSASALGGFGNSAAANIMGGQTNLGGALAAGTIGANAAQNQGIGGLLGAFGSPNNNPSSSAFGPSSAFGQLGTGIGNLFSGYNWNGTPGSTQLDALTAQANANVANGTVNPSNPV